MKLVLQLILVLAIVFIAASAYTLWTNRLPWKEPPGFLSRLSIYLTQNVAETSEDAILPELRPRTMPIEAPLLLDDLTKHVIALGWQLDSVDMGNLTLTASETTQWLKFTDDISIRLEPLPNKQTRIHIRSASRIGRADYGTNLARILRLYWNLGI